MNQAVKKETPDAVNSQPYWEQRFAGDWESNHGREQSRFFSRLALDHFPSWLTRTIKAHQLSVCDWGCAQGDGTDLLAQSLPDIPVTGVDFSAEAIRRATESYPRCKFVFDDFLTSPANTQFDVVFSSNTLEHFVEPWSVLAKLFARTRGFLVLLLPFREYERIQEHFSTFDYENIPFAFSDWALMHSEVIDAAAVKPNYWNGEQVLLVYGRTEWADKLRISLAEITLQSPAIGGRLEQAINAVVAERDEVRDALAAAVAERDAIRMEIDRLSAERDAAIASSQRMRDSRSWRLTGPLRFAMRLGRYGLIADDRRKLHQGLRSSYHRLPLPYPMKKAVSWAYSRFVREPYRVLYRQATAAAQFNPPSLSPAVQNAGLPDYIVWGVIGWHFRHQRPQQLAQALARSGRRVFYVSVDLVDDERPGFTVEALDTDGRLFQVRLFAKGAPVIYTSAPSTETVSQLRGSIGEVLHWADSRNTISLVQHPFWHGIATVLPNSRTIYDCMDHHEGFGNTAADILTLEHALFRDADLTITTSAWLDQTVSQHTGRRALIRNAGDFDHFSRPPSATYRAPMGKRIIGYYGAIAEWFDQEMVEMVARRFADCCVLLVGADTVNAKARLGRLPNVQFIGEVPYAELPFYLHAFDVCLLPFKVIPLTLATNPVKVYEYLSAGKSVVSVALPEMKQFGELVRTVDNVEAFVSAVDDVLAHPATSQEIAQRMAFAKEQTWRHRAQAMIAHVEVATGNPKASIIVVTYNNLDLTRVCLASLDRETDYAPMEIIVVDNASSDGSPEFLREWASSGPNRTIILNEDNRGFAAANNQGLAVATGDYLVLLNNDTCVTPGWVGSLIRHMQRDESIGLIGPVTNNIGNEAKINIAYDSLGDMPKISAAYTRRHIGKTFSLRTAAFFCVMLPRHVYERVGPLDEAFGRGFFEDDDYCRRVEQAGLRIVCADDVFIHHHLSASFGKLKNPDRIALFEQNKAIYEAKWGKWVAHGYRKDNRL